MNLKGIERLLILLSVCCVFLEINCLDQDEDCVDEGCDDWCSRSNPDCDLTFVKERCKKQCKLCKAPVDRYTSLGCWKDKTNRAIKGYEGVLGIDGCYERAKSKHFDTFAVQSGGQCYTSPTASDTYRIYGPSKGCSSDGTGGTWSQEVYKIDRKFRSLGCWKDNRNRAIKGNQGYLGIKGCYERAKSKGHSVFAVQSGGICFTSATAQNTYKKYGPSTKCSKSGTGGSWCQEVYNIEQWSFMGKGYCERVPGRKQLSRNAKTVSECKTLCENDRHRTCKFISYQFMKMNGRNYCYGYPKCHTQLNYRDDYESYSMGPNTE